MSPASGAGAGGRRVTIRSMSCRGVKAFVPFQKPPLYATVSLGGRREKTPPDTDGGENPDWEGAVAAFDLDGREQLVQFEVKAQVPFLGNKFVGTASVPVADLAAGDGDGAALRHVSYQVRAPDGKSNGTLSFAYAISSGARPQPQLHTVPDGAPPEQGPGFCSAPPPPAVTAYPPPSTANFAPHGGGYPPPPSPPPPVSGSSLYPSLQDLLPSSTYPPPASTLPYPAAMANPHFPEPNSSSYPPPPPAPASVYPPQAPDSAYPPPAPDSAYPPPTDSCTAYPAPPAHYTSSYPPQPGPRSSYPPPPPSGYPPPASSLGPPTSTYPPPPQPESGSAYPVLPRSVDRELPNYPAPSSTYPAPPGGSYYPPPGLDDGAARTPYYYPAPGSRYP